MNELSDAQILLEIEAIKQLKARQSRAIDVKDWATYEAVHAPGHISDVDGDEPWVGAKENTDRLARLHKELGIVSVHHAHSPQIELCSPTRATGIWAMECYLFWHQGEVEHHIHAFGFYHETYEKQGDQWLFTSRRLERTRVTQTPGAVFPVSA